MEMKPKFEFGTVPVLEMNGKRYTQSKAILRFLGRTYGYYPESDPEQAFLIDSGIDGIEDLVQKYMKLSQI